ncbi:periodic tryptophan protein 1 homolog, partial [Eurytemora carolleeae]|uniref:periodic tryptophan protein 1 homolog n=1 Tax=Eurytemora carolleeae TaxID=1294199 RepID=UPI000C765EE6
INDKHGKIIIYFQGEIADIDEDSSDEKENIADGEDSPTVKTEGKKDKTDQDIEDEYGLNEYDDEEDGIDSKKLFGLGDLTVFADPGEDPYLDQEQPDEDEEDVEDFKIRGTDNLILAGHVEGDSATLEVYVYNDVEDALYVHHDLLLPSLPLALEWLSFDPESDTKGSLVAVGSMQPEIQVWDLDIVDCLEPAFTLGRKAKKKKNIPGVGHTDAVLALAWNQGAEHILASGSVDQTVLLWDLGQKSVASTLKYHKEKVQSLAWHPFDPQTLATGCCDKKVRVADCRTQDSYKKWKVTGEVERVIWDHFNPFQCIACTDAGTIHCIDVRTETATWTLSAHTEDVTGISLSTQCPGCLVSVSADKSMKVWDIRGNKPEFIMERQMNLGLIQSVVGCPDAPFVICLAGDKPSENFKVMDIRESAQVRQKFGSRKLENPLKTSDFGYATADEAEPANVEMETESAADVLQTLSLEPAVETSLKPSGGAASKFKKKDKKKKKKNF